MPLARAPRRPTQLLPAQGRPALITRPLMGQTAFRPRTQRPCAAPAMTRGGSTGTGRTLASTRRACPAPTSPSGNLALRSGNGRASCCSTAGSAKNSRPGSLSEAHAHGAVPLDQIEPTGISIAKIADGGYDAYLKSYAKAVRSYGHHVIIGFAHEMNGSWYPWGWTHVSPHTWVRAWQRVVTDFRSAGRGQRDLAVDREPRSGSGPVQRLLAGRFLRELGGDRRVLHRAAGHVRQRVQPRYGCRAPVHQ